jgi:hypothetical protein
MEASMRRTTLLALAVVAAAPAYADAFVPVPQLADMVLDQDTANGKYSVWRIAHPETLNAIRTAVQVHRLGQDDRWAPGFGIFLKSGDKEVAFQIFSDTRQPPLAMHLFANKDGTTTEDQKFAATLGLDQKLDLAIDWTADGVVTVEAGGEKHTIALGAPVTSVDFSSSTGEVEFNPLQIGRTGPWALLQFDGFRFVGFDQLHNVGHIPEAV